MPISDETKMLQMLATQMHVLLAITAARDMHAKSYHELGQVEKDQIEGIVGGMIRHYWNFYAPDNLLGMLQSSSSDSVQ